MGCVESKASKVKPKSIRVDTQARGEAAQRRQDLALEKQRTYSTVENQIDNVKNSKNKVNDEEGASRECCNIVEESQPQEPSTAFEDRTARKKDGQDEAVLGPEPDTESEREEIVDDTAEYPGHHDTNTALSSKEKGEQLDVGQVESRSSDAGSVIEQGSLQSEACLTKDELDKAADICKPESKFDKNGETGENDILHVPTETVQGAN